MGGQQVVLFHLDDAKFDGRTLVLIEDVINEARHVRYYC